MIVVVSDLHLSEGRSARTGKLAPTEDFFFDEEFARFLAYLDASRAEPVNLVINGDLFDFLQVGICADDIEADPRLAQLPPREQAYICKYGAKTDENSTIVKLDKISRGHPVFFEALGTFVERGNKLTIVIGNHDVELFWPGVRQRFTELVCGVGAVKTLADGGDPDKSIEFMPWIFYDAEHGLYVEHGHQYESLNSFRYWMYPVLPQKPDEINLPFGSLFVRYLLNKVEEINPFADNIKPNTRYVGWAIRQNPAAVGRLLRLLGRFILTLAKSYRRSGNLSAYAPKDEIFFTEETNRRLKQVASRFSLGTDVDDPEHPFQKIRRLSEPPFNQDKGRFVWQAVLANIDILLLFLAFGGLGASLFLAWRFGPLNAFSAGALLIGILGLAVSNLFFKVGAAMSQANLDAASGIAQAYRAAGYGLRSVVFGHTHEPEIAEVGEGVRYYNTGTWGVIFNTQEELIREKQQFTLWMQEDPGSDPRLLRWNDAVGIPEPVLLFESK